jgi:hypothetical protein
MFSLLETSFSIDNTVHSENICGDFDSATLLSRLKAKKKMKLSYSPLLTLHILISSVVNRALAGGGFGETCISLRLDEGPFLEGYCSNGHGVYGPTSLNLDLCVVNMAGNLEAGDE